MTAVEAGSISSRYFGSVAWDHAAEIHFPIGLPGFETESCLVALEVPEQRPLVYLQSTANPDLCFLTIPASAVSQDFSTDLTEEEREILLFGPSEHLTPGQNLIALTIIYSEQGIVQVNLSAPVIINVQKMVAMQRIPESGKLIRHFDLRDSGEWVRSC